MSNSSKKWLWIAGIVAVIYVIGRSGTENSGQDSTVIKANAIIPLRQIAGKSRNEVEKIVGKGKFVKNWKDKRAGCVKCPKYFYRGDTLEIIYIDGKADRITINNPAGYSFNEDLTAALGLPSMAPSFNNGDVMRWYGYENLREVMAAGDGHGNINFVLVKAIAD